VSRLQFAAVCCTELQCVAVCRKSSRGNLDTVGVRVEQHQILAFYPGQFFFGKQYFPSFFFVARISSLLFIIFDHGILSCVRSIPPFLGIPTMSPHW